MLRIAAILATLLLGLPAYAVEDRTGLKVELPQTFAVEIAPRLNIFEAVIGVNLTSGEAFGANARYMCEVTFDKQPGWIGLSQQRFNDKLSDPEYPFDFARQVSSVFTVLRSERFEMRGIVGHEFIMIPRNNPAMIAVTNAMETPAGKTAVSCLASSKEFERAMPIFRAILAGVTPPGTAAP